MKKKKTLTKSLAVFLALLLGASQGVIAQTENGKGKTFKQEELDQLLAPIALYPDSLLAQILMASTYPLEVVQAGRWIKANQTLKGDALTAALEKENWDPSVKSLVNFPQVLDQMNEKLDWTQKLGDAFLVQQKDVMDTVQKLREKAEAQGNLESSEQQKVIVEKEKGEMIGGFALVAYPAKYASSGIMTFIVNHDGTVYQKDLGPNTEKAAQAMELFDPDGTWKKE